MLILSLVRLWSESEETTFSAPVPLAHFRESLHRISIESLLGKKLFGRAPPRFIQEAAHGALPNKPLRSCSSQLPVGTC